MKFNFNLDYYQNLQAWRVHRESTPPQSYTKLHAKQKAWLMQLNTLLTQLENRFLPILNAKYKELQARSEDSIDWMIDFSLDYVTTFYIREDDPEFEIEDDNILMQIETMHFIKQQNDQAWGFGYTNENYADGTCFEGERHCYTYHQLYDHFCLDWLDILRIGNIRIDLRIDEQSNILTAAV